MGQNKGRCRIHGKLGGVLIVGYASIQGQCITVLDTYLKDMSHRVFTVDLFLHNTILVDSDRRQDIQDRLIHGLKTVDNKGDRNPLPPWDTFLRAPPPVFGLFRLANVTNIQPVVNESLNHEIQ